MAQAAINDIIAQLLAAQQPQAAAMPTMGSMVAPAQPMMLAADDNVHTIAPGPEYNKWDETLQQYGRIRLPKELDDPQTWLSQDHIKRMLDGNGIDREDRPDGSVILSRQVPVS